MKISGIKVNCNFELGELDLSIKDLVDAKIADRRERLACRKEDIALDKERIKLNATHDKSFISELAEMLKDEVVKAVRAKIKGETDEEE